MIKPTRSFVLTYEGKKKVIRINCWQLKNTISLCVFIKKENYMEMKGMKSHDYHVVMQEILLLCLWNLLTKDYRMALIHLSRVFKELCSKIVDLATMGDLKQDVALTLLLLE